MEVRAIEMILNKRHYAGQETYESYILLKLVEMPLCEIVLTAFKMSNSYARGIRLQAFNGYGGSEFNVVSCSFMGNGVRELLEAHGICA